jgi:3-dehydroquinate synthase
MSIGSAAFAVLPVGYIILFFPLLCREGKNLYFSFGEYKTEIFLCREIPDIQLKDNVLFITDENTNHIAAKIYGNNKPPVCVLKSGEENKNWQSVEKILAAAHTAGIDRDGHFVAVGGGVIGDLAGFAASIYKRGCRLVIVSTTLLAMVDASVGGKTGFDLFGIKNLAGSFYPAQSVYMPLESLASLPAREWKSGIAELIKTAIIAGDDFLDEIINGKEQITQSKLFQNNQFWDRLNVLYNFIEKAVLFKGGIVSEDFRESGKRKLLNLGHTFGHALESVTGLGNISHGEAVAWGIVRACELGLALGITPQFRAVKIKELIASFGYECSCPHPNAGDHKALLHAMNSDKKKKQGKMTFIIPDEKNARPVILETENDLQILNCILKGSN